MCLSFPVTWSLPFDVISKDEVMIFYMLLFKEQVTYFVLFQW